MGDEEELIDNDDSTLFETVGLSGWDDENQSKDDTNDSKDDSVVSPCGCDDLLK